MKPSPNRTHRARWSRIGWALGTFMAIALAHSPAQAQAQVQAPAPAAPVAAPAGAQAAPARPAGTLGENYYRWGFFTLDQIAFKTHPFFQITGNSSFENGKAATGLSLIVGAPKSDSKSDALTQLLHALPSFYVEAGRPVELFLPKAVSLGFDYYAFSQKDSQAASGGTVAPIQMDLWLYQLAARAFAFDPNQPGINFFGGIGFGILDGNLTAQPTTAQPSSVTSINQFPTGSFMFGIEAKGDNFGMRYELTIFSAKQVTLGSNPFGGPKKIDFSGSLTRLAVFYQF